MKTLRRLRHSGIIPGATDKDSTDFSHRQAVRAIVTNPVSKIALLYVAKYKYHKLPGGGVEEGEDIAQALQRELVEEIGCHAKIISELGQIIEYRNKWDQKQTSECFLAAQVGEAHDPDFTEKELTEGFTVIWAHDLEHAISLLENDSPGDYGGKFIRERDLTFLKAAKELQLNFYTPAGII